MTGIDGYEPDLVHSRSELLDRHAERLAGLPGSPLTAAYLLWDVDDDSWFSDGPVILAFGDEQLEFAAVRADEYTVSWSQLEVSRPSTWMGSTLSLMWRRSPFPELAELEGAVLRRLDVLEWCEGEGRDCQLNGFELTFDARRVRFYNALDENGLVFDPAPDRADRLTTVT